MAVDNLWIDRRLRDLRTDPVAFEELYAEMKQPMYAVAYRVVMNAEDAEDVVQESFISLLRYAEADKIRNGRAYLFQMVRNEALKKLKTRGRETACEDPEIYRGVSVPVGGSDVDRAMATLSAEDRQIVSMHAEAGLTFPKIAKIMGISTATAFRRYRQAIKSLQKFFGRSGSKG